MSIIKSLFLGPKAENLDLFRKLCEDILLDAAFLRRNYQPGEDPIITEHDKTDKDYVEASSRMRQYLQSILADLKKCVPTYHPRHVGHMTADVFMTGIAGFIGGMMYNPNNIINVTSPSTTDMEVEYINWMCRMIGYKPVSSTVSENLNGSWGHLCSGGTSANIEALWVLRNLKYYPVTLKLAVNSVPMAGEVKVEALKGALVRECTFQQLFNLPVGEIYRLVAAVATDEVLSRPETRKLVEEYSVQNLGVAGVHEAVSEAEGNETLPLPKVFLSRTHHYSWEKAMDIIGLGRRCLKELPTDRDFRLNIADLEEELSNSGPVLAVVDIMGTTEEGAFDPLDEIVALREKCGKGFFIHVDGAYGGYFASMLNGRKEGEDLCAYLDRIGEEEHCFKVGEDHVDWAAHFNFDATWRRRVEALRDADSVTIDPHKLGYIPYPAGAILFKECTSRHMTRIEAPYVSNDSSKSENEIYLGQWTLEGSRPGAAAAACYYSGKVLPLDAENHGRLLACTVISAAKLFQAIDRFNQGAGENDFTIVPLYKTDSNSVCYIVANKGLIKSPTILNRFTKALVDEFTIKPGKRMIPDYDFIVSTSSWPYEKYRTNICGILQEAGIGAEQMKEMEGNDLHYIRSMMMNPLSAYEPDTFFDSYMNDLNRILKQTLVKVFSELVFEKKKGLRYNILWVENEDSVKKQKDSLLADPGFGYGIDIDFHTYGVQSPTWIPGHMDNYDAILVDLNLMDNNHEENPNAKWVHSLSLIKELKKRNKNAHVFVCSRYLSKTNPFHQLTRESLLDAANGLHLEPEDLLAKDYFEDGSLDLENNKLHLMERIFRSLQ